MKNKIHCFVNHIYPRRLYVVITDSALLLNKHFINRECDKEISQMDFDSCKAITFRCTYRIDKKYGICRGIEIDRWLWEHEDVINYVILDDDSDMLLSQKKHFIKTHALRGISKRDVEKAIKILNS